jgi:hypothetical protein
MVLNKSAKNLKSCGMIALPVMEKFFADGHYIQKMAADNGFTNKIFSKGKTN